MIDLVFYIIRALVFGNTKVENIRKLTKFNPQSHYLSIIYLIFFVSSRTSCNFAV